MTDSPDCHLLLEDATQWRLWEQGKLLFDTASNTFQAAADVYQRQGFISAVFYASSERDVEPLVDHLKALDCDVKHQLDQQKQLMSLAVALAVLVALFVSGSVVNASFNSGAVSWMDLTTKLREIGIKMAHGLTRTDIVLAYVAEGALVGLLSCLAGGGLVLALEPVIRQLICGTMGLTNDFFLVGVLSPALAWLYAIAALVVVSFNMLGAFVPTWLALRKTPVELLR